MEKKNWKENHATKVTRIPKTKRRKYGTKETMKKLSIMNAKQKYRISVTSRVQFPLRHDFLNFNVDCCYPAQRFYRPFAVGLGVNMTVWVGPKSEKRAGTRNS